MTERETVTLGIFTPRQREVQQIIRNAAPESLTILGFGGAIGGGKEVDITLPIPTPSGWTLNGDLVDGDIVFGECGQPVTVLKAHPIHNTPDSYLLTFDDGTEIKACADHLWHTFTAKELQSLSKRTPEYRARRRESRPSRAKPMTSPARISALATHNPLAAASLIKPPPQGGIRTTKEIFNTLRDGNFNNHAIPVSQPLILPEAPLPFDPYLLGLWLGDGSKDNGTYACHPADMALVNAWRSGGFVVTPRTDKITHGILGLMPFLRKLGVFNNKHIPMEYLRALKEQRLALLQGLMDTDGTVAKNSGAAEFCNTNRAIVDGVYDLIVGLGWKARVREGRAKLNGRDCGPKWTIKWVASEYVFRLERKRTLQRLATRRTTKFRYIVDCQPIEPVPMRCITVDNPSGLYLAGKSMVPTHNTYLIAKLAIQFALDYPGSRLLLGREQFNNLKTTTMEEFYRILPPSLYTKNDTDHWCKIRAPNWPKSLVSTVFFRGLENWKSLGSEEYNFVGIDEGSEVARDAVLMLLTRMRHRLPSFVQERLESQCPECRRYVVPGAQCGLHRVAPISLGNKYVLLAGSNPWPGWFEDWFFRKDLGDAAAMLAASASLHFVPSKMKDNPYLPPNYEAIQRATLSGPWVQRMLDGEWGIFERQVYKGFSQDIHEWKSALPPGYVRVIGGLDFGGEREDSHFSTGMVAAVYPGGRLIRCGAFRGHGPDIADKQLSWMLAQQSLLCDRKENPHVNPKIQWRADKSQMVGIQMWRRMGLNVTYSRGGPDSIPEGVKVVEKYLRTDEDGVPGSWYMKSPEMDAWVQEMRSYEWDPITRKPVKKNDDMLDSDRYLHELLSSNWGDPQRLMKNRIPVIT